MTLKPSNSADARILIMRDVVKSFAGTRVLDGVSVEVRRGEVVCLIGPSGSGKSTLIKCERALAGHA